MPRISLAVLVTAAAIVFPTNAVASKHHGKHGKHHPKHHSKKPTKPGGIETGTYKATTTVTDGVATVNAPVEDFNITLASAMCTSAPGQGSPAQRLCVALQSGLYIVLRSPSLLEVPLSNFATPVALPSSDTLTEHAPTTADTLPDEPPATGQNTFSITFTKQGTASGYLEATMTGILGGETVTETPTKVPFTAKLG